MTVMSGKARLTLHSPGYTGSNTSAVNRRSGLSVWNNCLTESAKPAILVNHPPTDYIFDSPRLCPVKPSQLRCGIHYMEYIHWHNYLFKL